MPGQIEVVFDTQLCKLFDGNNNASASMVDFDTRALERVHTAVGPSDESKILLEFVHDDTPIAPMSTVGLTIHLSPDQPHDANSTQDSVELMTRIQQAEEAGFDAYIAVRIGGGMGGARLDPIASDYINSRVNAETSVFERHTLRRSKKITPKNRAIARSLNILAPQSEIDKTVAHEIKHAVDYKSNQADTFGWLTDYSFDAGYFITNRTPGITIGASVMAATLLARELIRRNIRNKTSILLGTTAVLAMVLPRIINEFGQAIQIVGWNLDPRERAAIAVEKRHSDSRILHVGQRNDPETGSMHMTSWPEFSPNISDSE